MAKCPRCTHALDDHRPVVNGKPFCYSCMDSPCHIPESVRIEMAKQAREQAKAAKRLAEVSGGPKFKKNTLRKREK